MMMMYQRIQTRDNSDVRFVNQKVATYRTHTSPIIINGKARTMNERGALWLRFVVAVVFAL